jgi:hypothetical protein
MLRRTGKSTDLPTQVRIGVVKSLEARTLMSIALVRAFDGKGSNLPESLRSREVGAVTQLKSSTAQSIWSQFWYASRELSELLMVVGVFVVEVFMLLPVVYRAREGQRRPLSPPRTMSKDWRPARSSMSAATPRTAGWQTRSRTTRHRISGA